MLGQHFIFSDHFYVAAVVVAAAGATSLCGLIRNPQPKVETQTPPRAAGGSGNLSIDNITHSFFLFTSFVYYPNPLTPLRDNGCFQNQRF